MATPNAELDTEIERIVQFVPHLTLIHGGQDSTESTPDMQPTEIAQTLGNQAVKTFDSRMAYMPGPPAWDILPNSPHLVRGMVYPH